MQQKLKKILMISYVFPPIAYVGTYRSLRFCRYLPENGWLPEVLTIERGDDLHNDDRLLDLVPSQIKIHRTYTIDFWRMWQKYLRRKKIESTNKETSIGANPGRRDSSPGNSFVSEIKRWLSELVTIPDHMVFWVPFALRRGISIIRNSKIDLIYTSSPPHSEHLIGLILSKLFRIPWVADFRDPMLDSSGYAPPTKIRCRIDQWLERMIVEHAQKVLIISDSYRELIETRYPLFEEKFVTMPNGYDPKDFDNVQADSFDKFTIIYSGAFYANRSPRFFLEGFRQWYMSKPRDVRNNVQVIFYGAPSTELRRYVEGNGLQDIVISPGLIPKEQLIPKLKGADLLLLIIGFDPESRGTVTSKIFEYMSCHRPILAIMPKGDASEVLKFYEPKYWVDSEDHDLLHDCLDRAYSNHHDQKISRESLDRSVGYEADTFNAKHQTRDLAHLFYEITNSRAVSRDLV